LLEQKCLCSKEAQIELDPELQNSKTIGLESERIFGDEWSLPDKTTGRY
jgi:hypothetical protein